MFSLASQLGSPSSYFSSNSFLLFTPLSSSSPLPLSLPHSLLSFPPSPSPLPPHSFSFTWYMDLKLLPQSSHSIQEKERREKRGKRGRDRGRDRGREGGRERGEREEGGREEGGRREGGGREGGGRERGGRTRSEEGKAMQMKEKERYMKK